MGRVLAIVLAVLAVVLIGAATVRTDTPSSSANSPEAAVQSLLDNAKARNWEGAYQLVAKQSNTERNDFVRDLAGRDGSLRTYSSLQSYDTKVLRETDSDAMIRTNIQWSTAVGAFYDTKDLKVVREENNWRVVWPVEKQAKAPPQVIPVNYLRWDIVQRGSDDDWGAQNVEAPRVRIVSMNAIERDNSVIIMGELVNEDTVPGFVTVGATLVGKDGNPIAQESSFDKISHTVLPKEVSPFRVDFPKVKLANVKSVRMQPNALLVPASADPTIGVLHQRIETNVAGKKVLRGELVNQSGQIVNIPHVLATFYDNAGKVIWVNDGYVDKALQPQTPVPFAVDLRDDLAASVQSYRVSVNEYSINRQ